MSSSSDEDTPLAAMKPIPKKRKATAEGAASGAGVKAAANGGSSSGDRKAKAPKSYKEDNSDDDDGAFEEPKLKKKVKSSGGGGSSTKEDKESGKKRKIVVKKSRAEESDDDEDDEDDDFEDTQVKKKAKAKPAPSADAKKRASGSSKAKAKPAASAASNGRKKEAKAAAAPAKKRASGAANGARKPAAKVKAERPAGKFKDSTQLERLDHAMKAYKWWEEPPLAPGRQWSHLEHNGMSFPDEYEPHGVPLMYDGEEMELSPEDEEIATFFADVPLDGPQLGDAATAKVFSANFFSDWKESMPTGHPLKNAKFDKCDFGAMRAHLQQRRLIKKAATDGERAAAKAEKERRFHLFGLAIVDGHLEKVGNFIMEPPGLFRGRGKHPKTGKLKKRAYPSEVTVNIGEEAKVPQCPVPGFAWGNVQHDPGVAWLSTWKENINNMNKYAMLSASSSFKGKSDMEKYNKAMRLKGHIDAIRRNYERGLNASTSEMRQLATAMWLIDKLALRVGGEKGEDEADTVGCCTLRVEHMTFGPAGTREMELEFLGKDSMLFKQNIDFTAYGDIGSKVFDNLTAFCKGRKPAEQVFQKIDPTTLNKHLQSLMPGLSAKVFRTYNASETLQQQLPSADALKNMTVQAKVVEYNNANREVAILCNHQRTVSGAMLKSFENLGERVAKVKEQRADLKAWLKLAKDGKAKKIPLKGRGSSQDADDDEEKVKAAIQKAKDAKANATTSEEKVAATKLAEAAATAKKELVQRKFEGSHMFANTPSEEQLQRKIEGWTTKLKKMEVDLRDKEQNKEVSLGTSKINYMDPRISVAWCKRNEVPIERIFAKTLRDKFVWAMNVPPDWRFDFETLRAVTAESSDEPKAVTAVADDADANSKGKGDDDEEEEEEDEEEMD